MLKDGKVVEVLPNVAQEDRNAGHTMVTTLSQIHRSDDLKVLFRNDQKFEFDTGCYCSIVLQNYVNIFYYLFL